jgi:hypothetical protein
MMLKSCNVLSRQSFVIYHRKAVWICIVSLFINLLVKVKFHVFLIMSLGKTGLRFL